MSNVSRQNATILLKLTCFWAFIEAGLGGLLHLFHIPVTGFVIGGFAIIIIVLISKYSNRHFLSVVNALAIVLAIKFFLSPYSPAGAYIAVAFQGLLGAFLFSFIALNNITVTIFSMLVMLESALQKPLMAWLLLGSKFWKSTIIFFQKESGFSIHTMENTFFIILLVYLLIYILWGIVISRWANYVRKHIETISIDKNKVEAVKQKALVISTVRTQRKRKTAIIIFGVLFISFLMILLFTKMLSISYLLRITVVFFIFFFIIPFLIKKRQKYFIKRNKSVINEVLKTIPAIKSKIWIAYKLVRPVNSLQRIKLFIVYSIWLNVFYED